MTTISAEAHLRTIREAVIKGVSYKLSDEYLRDAPSDALDGWAYAREVQPLVDRGILYTVPIPREDQTLGNTVTWGFTDAGMTLAKSWIASLQPKDTPNDA
ncbi:hypothetical protein [Methylobacterium indicum]|uniref:hypothetical protein n=1 Tax=Methylobacterium indicum TaxID=1775910 RepID=UPI000653B4E8|nr:hypothetical protein [Methylobacterium indicum]